MSKETRFVAAQIRAMLALTLACGALAAEGKADPASTTSEASRKTDGKAGEPADRDLIPEARALLKYMESQYGKRTLSAVNGGGDHKAADMLHEVSGVWPAIQALDLSGWNSPTWGKNYTLVIQRSIDAAKAWGEKGGIVSMQFHWKNPMNDQGSAWKGKPQGAPVFKVANYATPGSAEHKAFMDDLKKHAGYLQNLADARVPVLWRPFHEIDGGWFWWTDKEEPENTPKLWRMMFDYLVKERRLHNLIWVYSAGIYPGALATKSGKYNIDPNLPVGEEIAFRRRYYPGEKYVDIAGIDIYSGFPKTGYGSAMTDTYAKGFAIMEQVAPGKMIALSECEAMLDPELLVKNGPKWLYVLPWWGANPPKTFPPDWNKRTYSHGLLIKLDELPHDLLHGTRPTTKPAK